MLEADVVEKLSRRARNRVVARARNSYDSRRIFSGVQYHMIGFVDDLTCIVVGDKNDTIETLKEKKQEDAQL